MSLPRPPPPRPPPPPPQPGAPPRAPAAAASSDRPNATAGRPPPPPPPPGSLSRPASSAPSPNPQGMLGSTTPQSPSPSVPWTPAAPSPPPPRPPPPRRPSQPQQSTPPPSDSHPPGDSYSFKSLSAENAVETSGPNTPAGDWEVPVLSPASQPDTLAVEMESNLGYSDPAAYLQSLRRAHSPHSQQLAAAEAAAAREEEERSRLALLEAEAQAKAEAEEMFEYKVESNRANASRVPFSSAKPPSRSREGGERSLEAQDRSASSLDSTPPPARMTAQRIAEMLSQRCQEVEGTVRFHCQRLARALRSAEDAAATYFLLEHKHKHAMKMPSHPLASTASSSAPAAFSSSSSAPAATGNAMGNGLRASAQTGDSSTLLFSHLDELFPGGEEDDGSPSFSPTKAHASNLPVNSLTETSHLLDPFELVVLGDVGSIWAMKDIQEILTNSYLCKIKGLQASIANNVPSLHQKIDGIVRTFVKKRHKQSLLASHQILHDYYQKGEQRLLFRLIYFEEVLERHCQQVVDALHDEIQRYWEGEVSKQRQMQSLWAVAYEQERDKYLSVLQQVLEEGGLHNQCNAQLHQQINQHMLELMRAVPGQFLPQAVVSGGERRGTGGTFGSMAATLSSSLSSSLSRTAALTVPVPTSIMPAASPTPGTTHDPSAARLPWTADLDFVDNRFLLAYSKLLDRLEAQTHASWKVSEDYATRYRAAVQAAGQYKRRLREHGEEQLSYITKTLEGYYVSFLEDAWKEMDRLVALQHQAMLYDKQLGYYVDKLRRQHNTRLRKISSAHGGQEAGTEGDSRNASKMKAEEEARGPQACSPLSSSSEAKPPVRRASSNNISHLIQSINSRGLTAPPSPPQPSPRQPSPHSHAGGKKPASFSDGDKKPTTTLASTPAAPAMEAGAGVPLEQDIEVLLDYYSYTTGPRKQPVFKMGTKICLQAELAGLSPQETVEILTNLLATCQKRTR